MERHNRKDLIYWALLSLLIVLWIWDSYHHNTNEENEGQVELQFQNFIKKYGKNYKSPEERLQRFTNFKKTVQELNDLHSGKLRSPANKNSVLWGINKFSDLSQKEFEETYLMMPAPKIHRDKNADKRWRLKSSPLTSTLDSKEVLSILPKRVDWRLKNVITPVRDQHHCGSCWAHTAVSILESFNAIERGVLQQLSVQQVMDCTRDQQGCTAYDTWFALSWMSTHKIVSEEKYRTTLAIQECRDIRDDTVLTATPGSQGEYFDMRGESFTTDEFDMLKLLATKGPLAVNVNASTWRHYKGGVLNIPYPVDSDNMTDHAVQIVGYDISDPGNPFYYVRNSWGEHFGLDGYLLLRFGVNSCGVGSAVSWLESQQNYSVPIPTDY